MHKTGIILVDLMLGVLVFIFPPIYEFCIGFIAMPIREFFIETKEIVQWLVAVLVLIKFIKDLFFTKNKEK